MYDDSKDIKLYSCGVKIAWELPAVPYAECPFSFSRKLVKSLLQLSA